jgi:hypothetical protein
MSDLSAKKVASDVHQFLASELGKFYIDSLAVKYNELHQTAEDEGLTAGQKAAKIDRAAGLKMAIDFLTMRNAAFERGEFEDKE